MTKEDFSNFAIMMKKNSNILFNNGQKHTSVYLAGYVLEAYIKIILIYKNEPSFIGHLGDSDFLNKFRRIISLYPEFQDNILNSNHIKYPKKLFNGGGNNTTKASWKIEHRYKVNNWTDESFCQNIQEEMTNVHEALIDLRTLGIL